eukprot:CAMPEP_0184272076 /NCGR_PEP_ID=MMETSP0977-20130417/40794_1 /TAXON_ID=483370 /ORGANISM="non described non described, Strain CCMP2097" /LENGTH=674 /DNA_ID=CAMNT_0026577939 /DNA_START=32 /DNA_END=2053 /DNA_ORIENTATION=+
MPLVQPDPGAALARLKLEEFVVKCGGTPELVVGWTTELYSRLSGKSGGDTDRYWYDASAKKYRSNAEIARALQLDGAPKKKEKGDHTATRLAPGETPCSVAYGDGAAPTTLAAAAAALILTGDFSEFLPHASVRAASTAKRQPPRWRPLAANAYVWPAASERSEKGNEWSTCHCAADGCEVDSNCINRELYVECSNGHCRGGAARDDDCRGPCVVRRSGRTGDFVVESMQKRAPCGNTKIQRHQYPPMEIFDTGSDVKGFGLRCARDVRSGTFLGEYRGEVITDHELMERKAGKAPEAPFYFAAMGNGLYVDAERRGAYARFANHSCEPNCRMEKWMVGSEARLVLVATMDVAAKRELTYDYNAGGGANDITHDQPCLCGAPNCARSIGAKPKDAAELAAEEAAALEASRAGRKRKPAAKLRAEAPPAARAKNGAKNGAAAHGSAGKKQRVTSAPAPPLSPSPKADGPLARMWALDTLRKFGVEQCDAASAPVALVQRVEALARRVEQRASGRALHCLCRLPEPATIPALADSDCESDALVCCDGCDAWYHAACARVPRARLEDAFQCPRCSRDFGPLAAAGARGLWARELPSATRADARTALRSFHSRVTDAVDAADAAGLLLLALDDADAWHGRAEAALSQCGDHAVVAELWAQGTMNDLVEDATLLRLAAR